MDRERGARRGSLTYFQGERFHIEGKPLRKTLKNTFSPRTIFARFRFAGAFVIVELYIDRAIYDRYWKRGKESRRIRYFFPCRGIQSRRIRGFELIENILQRSFNKIVIVKSKNSFYTFSPSASEFLDETLLENPS